MLGPSESRGSALVVDDDRAVAAVLAAFLQRLGLTVTVAHSQQEGEARLRDQPWTLLVTDLQLGAEGLEGFALIDLARSRHPEVRAILVSGAGSPDLAGQARQRGADLFLAKPISFAALSAGVESLLGAA